MAKYRDMAIEATIKKQWGWVQCPYTKKYYRIKNMDADHIWPKKYGGPDAYWNLVMAGSSANRSKGAKIDHRIIQGYSHKIKTKAFYTINQIKYNVHKHVKENNYNIILKKDLNMSNNKIEINSENLESYLELVKQCKENILELNSDMRGSINSLQDDWDELGYDEFSEFFHEKIENRMGTLVMDIIDKEMINKLNIQIEKHKQIENHKL